MEFDIQDIWAAAGILVGFQITSFAWRISQEVRVADRGDISWIAPADYLNLAAMLVTAGGVFVLPVLEPFPLTPAPAVPATGEAVIGSSSWNKENMP